MRVIDIPRTTAELQQGGCWWWTTSVHVNVVSLRCPDCNQLMHVDKPVNGKVTQANCDRCSFNSYVRLLDWSLK
jgi:hypothetical protein